MLQVKQRRAMYCIVISKDKFGLHVLTMIHVHQTRLRACHIQKLSKVQPVTAGKFDIPCNQAAYYRTLIDLKLKSHYVACG